MSAAPRRAADFGYAGLRMGAADFLAIGETEERLRLIDGVVVMSPRPTLLHQRILGLVLKQLAAYLDAHPSAECLPEVDWELRGDTVYSPDIVCYAPGRVRGNPVRLSDAPDLVVEVLSPGTKAFDLTTKKDDYERCGVGEYWTIDSADARVRSYRREAGRLIEIPVTGDAIQSSALAGFTLDIKPLRTAVGPGGR